MSVVKIQARIKEAKWA